MGQLDDLLTSLGHVPSGQVDARVLRLAGAILNCLASGQGPALVLDISLAPLLLGAMWPTLWESARAALCLRTLFGIESLDSVSQSTVVLVPSELRPRWHGRSFIGEDPQMGTASRWFAGSESPALAQTMELNGGRLPGDLTVLERVERIVGRLEKMRAGTGTLADALVVVRTQEAFSAGFVLSEGDKERLAAILGQLEAASVSDVRTASLVRLDAFPDLCPFESALTRWVIAHLQEQSPADALWLLEQQVGANHAPWWRRGLGQGVTEACCSRLQTWATAIWQWWQARPAIVPLVMHFLD